MDDEKIIIGKHHPEVCPDTKLPDGTYAAVMLCSCGAMLWYVESVRKHWLDGHFDTPIYATREEVLDRVAAKVADKNFESSK